MSIAAVVALVSLALALLLQAALLGANAFEAVVDVPNWRTAEGLRAYRAFTRVRNAGAFYRVVSPVSLVLLLVGLVAGWSGFSVRDGLVGAALVAGVIAEVVTVAYFFPRNRALFFEPIEAEPGPRSRVLVDEWARANVVRIAVVAAGWCALLAGTAATGRTLIG